MDDFLEILTGFFKYRRLTHKKYIIACSGGVDSLALLDSLSRLQDKLNIKLVAAHFEHGIRGDASKADAAFVEKMARLRNLEFRLGSADVPAEALRRRESLETTARNLRYEFLEQVRKETNADYILTAHHAGDQVETILMHLIRGAGLNGLHGMDIENSDAKIIRPLLMLPKSRMIKWCSEHDLIPCEDSTNSELDCTRNRVRLELLPLLRTFNPNIDAALIRMGLNFGLEDEYLDSHAHDAYLKAADNGKLIKENAIILAKLTPNVVLRQRVLRLMWKNVTHAATDLSLKHIDELVALIKRNQTGLEMSLPKEVTAKISYGKLIFCRDKAENKIAADSINLDYGELMLNDYSFSVARLDKKVQGTSLNEFCFIVPNDIAELTLRYRKTGDIIRLKSGTKKLKEVFIDDKIPRDERDKIPLLARGNEILWVVGYRRSPSYAADDNQANQNIIYIKAKRNEEQSHD